MTPGPNLSDYIIRDKRLSTETDPMLTQMMKLMVQNAQVAAIYVFRNSKENCPFESARKRNADQKQSKLLLSQV